MSKLLLSPSDFRDFGCADERVNEQGWKIVSIGGTHRDADVLTQSNHRVILRELAKLDPDEDAHGVMHAGHWAVGWVDHILVDPAREDLVKVLTEFESALSDYPIADEWDHSELELGWHDEGRCGDHCAHCEYEREDARHVHDDDSDDANEVL
jgi:hypothetical protein